MEILIKRSNPGENKYGPISSSVSLSSLPLVIKYGCIQFPFNFVDGIIQCSRPLVNSGFILLCINFLQFSSYLFFNIRLLMLSWSATRLFLFTDLGLLIYVLTSGNFHLKRPDLLFSLLWQVFYKIVRILIVGLICIQKCIPPSRCPPPGNSYWWSYKKYRFSPDDPGFHSMTSEMGRMHKGATTEY